MEYLAGLDIGGTNLKLGVVSSEGSLIKHVEWKTVDYHDVTLLAEAVTKQLEEWSLPVKGLGIGAPNGNAHTGEIISPPNLEWGTVAIKEKFQRVLTLPIKLTNDANAQALAEGGFGEARGCGNFIVLTLGTGLGSGIVCDHHLLLGANGMAGEAGHIPLVPFGRVCGCKGRGHFETYVSKKGIKRTIKELFPDHPQESIKGLYKDFEDGCPVATEVFNKTGEYLGVGLATLVNLFCPEKIILSGGIAKSYKAFAKSMKGSFEEHLFPNFRGQTEILPSKLPSFEGGILGAAALFLEEIKF